MGERVEYEEDGLVRSGFQCGKRHTPCGVLSCRPADGREPTKHYDPIICKSTQNIWINCHKKCYFPLIPPKTTDSYLSSARNGVLTETRYEPVVFVILENPLGFVKKGLCLFLLVGDDVDVELREGEGEGGVGGDGVVELLVVAEVDGPEVAAFYPCADSEGHG